MPLAPAHLRYLLVQQGFVPALFNFLLNSGLAWLGHRGQTAVSLTGSAGRAAVWAPGVLLPLLTCLIVVPLVRKDLEAGRIAPLTGARWLALALPPALLPRAVLVTALAFLVLVLPCWSALGIAEVKAWPMPGFAWLMGGYCAVLAAVVTPLVAWRTLLEPARA